MMKFATITLATILLLLAIVVVTSSSSVPSVRGAATLSQQEEDASSAWSITDTPTHRHRHLEKDNSDCLFVMRDTQFEDDGLVREGQSHVWVCEFPFAVSQSKLKGRIFIDIDVTDENGLTKAMIDSMGVISGASILKTTGAYIEESLDTGEMMMHIPNTATMEVISIDGEHNSQHSRRLVSPNPGTLSVLVIKVIDSVGAQIAATNAQLVNDIFDDEYCLKTGFASCSKNQLIIEPAANRTDGVEGVVNGITSVVVDIEAKIGNPGNHKQLEAAALNKTVEEYGNLPAQYDLVMMCLPQTGTLYAYAYINQWFSVYNDYWCQKVSAQMHEIGHNLGFGHSNKNGVEYADKSGSMTRAVYQDDGPKRCFNAAKNFQTGWYTNAQESFYPLDNKNSMVEHTLIGVNDYQVSPGTNDGNLVTLRLGDDRDDPWWGFNTGGDDYYLGFNLKEGINEGTMEAFNQVLLFQKVEGGPSQFGQSDRIKDLNPGDSYTITSFKGTPFDVTITVGEFLNNGQNAPIKITTECGANGCGFPTESPTESCSDNGGRFSLELNTDRYDFEISWKLFEQESDIIFASAPSSVHKASRQYLYPNPDLGDERYYCLNPSQCYTFKIQDKFSDGFFQGEGNYKLTIDDLVFVGGSVENFQAEELYSFCINGGPTNSPTNVPTHAPTNPPNPSASPSVSPISCDNLKKYLWNNRKRKNCRWVGKGNKKKKKKKCNLKDKIKGETIAFYCLKTCGIVGVGPCKKKANNS